MRRTFERSLKIEFARRGLTRVSVAEVRRVGAKTFRSCIQGYRPLPLGFRARFAAALDLVERFDVAAEEARRPVLAGGLP